MDPHCAVGRLIEAFNEVLDLLRHLLIPHGLGRPVDVHHHGPLEVGDGAGQWRKLSPSAELMVDPGCGARCAIRDTGAPGEGRYHWTVTVFGETDPVATGRTGELAGARSRAEGALHAYTDAELSSHGRSVSG
jgi:hypothetical protein